MGTVKGDVHDIGKNLVNIMLEGAGFTVYDLGVNVATRGVRAADPGSTSPDVVGFSAFLDDDDCRCSRANINALQKAGIRDDVIVMVGGRSGDAGIRPTPSVQTGTAADALDRGPGLAKDLIEKKRSAVPA